MIIFGDSHVALYSRLTEVRTEHLGAVTMYRMGRDGLAACGTNAGLIWPHTTVGFICGEIDIRVCFARQRQERNRDPADIVHRLVAPYLDAVDVISSAAAVRYAVAIFAVPPPSQSTTGYDSLFVRHGSDEERSEWTRLLNRALRDAAMSRGFIFVDQYSPFADERGFLDTRFSKDAVHVDPVHGRLVDLSACRERVAA